MDSTTTRTPLTEPESLAEIDFFDPEVQECPYPADKVLRDRACRVRARCEEKGWFPSWRYPFLSALMLIYVGAGAAQAQGACQQDLEIFDAQIAVAESLDPQMLQMVAMFREQAAQQCAQGHDKQASSSLSAVRAMLGSGILDGQQPAAEEQQAAGQQESAGNDTKTDAVYPLGTPRDDLERFYGIYGSSGTPNRDFFVAAARAPLASDRPVPEGYLMAGPMWADVVPWYLKSMSETRFEQQWVTSGSEQILIRFEFDDNGNPVALVFETVFEDRGRLERLGDLPESW